MSASRAHAPQSNTRHDRHLRRRRARNRRGRSIGRPDRSQRAGRPVGLFEQAPTVGGTTAVSGGVSWIPAHNRPDVPDPPTVEEALSPPGGALERHHERCAGRGLRSQRRRRRSSSSSATAPSASRSLRASPTTDPSSRRAAARRAVLQPRPLRLRAARRMGSADHRLPHGLEQRRIRCRDTDAHVGWARRRARLERGARTFGSPARRSSVDCCEVYWTAASSRRPNSRAVKLVNDGTAVTGVLAGPLTGPSRCVLATA